MASRQAETQEPPQNLSDLPPKQQAFALLRENGARIQEAAKTLGYSPSTAYCLNAKIQKRYNLTNKKLVASAHGVVKNILEGKPWGAVEEIKASSALMAAQMVYDRAQPIQKLSDVLSNVSFTQVNLYVSNAPTMQDIDIIEDKHE